MAPCPPNNINSAINVAQTLVFGSKVARILHEMNKLGWNRPVKFPTLSIIPRDSRKYQKKSEERGNYARHVKAAAKRKKIVSSTISRRQTTNTSAYYVI